MAMTNDGMQAYDHQNDGSTQQLAGCLRDFRNKPFPVKAKVEYYKNILTVRNKKGWLTCYSKTFLSGTNNVWALKVGLEGH